MTLEEFLNIKVETKHKIKYKYNNKIVDLFYLKYKLNTSRINIKSIYIDIENDEVKEDDIGVDIFPLLDNMRYELELPYKCYCNNIIINIIGEEV